MAVTQTLDYFTRFVHLVLLNGVSAAPVVLLLFAFHVLPSSECARI